MYVSMFLVNLFQIDGEIFEEISEQMRVFINPQILWYSIIIKVSLPLYSDLLLWIINAFLLSREIAFQFLGFCEIIH